ncbi:MAG: 4Fe-4S cluster-binding domain-containing protein [Eubacteriales bacterium]
MKNCNLCPNACNADRTASAGVCGVTDEIRIAKYYPHMYEEPVISGDRGSGAVFFCGCSLQCAFCQNYEVSRARRGKIITAKELADIFRKLEDMGVHNVNSLRHALCRPHCRGARPVSAEIRRLNSTAMKRRKRRTDRSVYRYLPA